MIKRIDAIEVNFVDSAARPEFKMTSSKGTGELRIYVGHDEKICDEFFDLKNITYFFTKKEDLVAYLENSKDEFEHPTQDYKNKLSDMYKDLVIQTKSINESIQFHFRKKYDKQHRYFLVLPKNDRDSKRKYKYIWNICLPRVTKFSFIKFVDDTTGNYYIYLKPQYYNKLDIDVDPFAYKGKDNVSFQTKGVKRKKQALYRKKVLEEMPACPFTHVSDDRLLVACHIKPFKDCKTDDERYDFHNGITMTPTYHVLFDQGLISFENDGSLLVSPFLNNRTQALLGLRAKDKKRIQNQSSKYLNYHRSNIFCRLPSDFVIDDYNKEGGYSIRYNDSENDYNFSNPVLSLADDNQDIVGEYYSNVKSKKKRQKNHLKK